MNRNKKTKNILKRSHNIQHKMFYRTRLLSLVLALAFALALVTIVVDFSYCSCECCLANRILFKNGFQLRNVHTRFGVRLSSYRRTPLIIVCDCACFSLHFISLCVFRISECKRFCVYLYMAGKQASERGTVFSSTRKLMTFFPTPASIHIHIIIYTEEKSKQKKFLCVAE